jgi:DNA-binding LacI/PurR family transcriptional regulator
MDRSNPSAGHRPRQHGRPTIHDVASAAGVSKSTVSNVFSQRVPVASETRRHVLAVSRQLGYAPNSHARGLARGRADAIALVTPPDMLQWLNQPGWGMTIIAATSEAASANRQQLLITPFQERLSEVPVDGFVLMGLQLTPEVLAFVRSVGRPSVVLNRHAQDPDLAWVCGDDASGMASAARYLAQLGHREIAFASCKTDHQPIDDRLLGFRQGLASVGLSLQDWQVLTTGQRLGDEAAGYELGAVVAPLVGRVTAVALPLDTLAVGLLQALSERGIRVPDDVSIVGCTDGPAAMHAIPALTTVRVPKRELATRAVSLLLAMIRGEAPALRQVMLPTELVVRASTGSLRSEAIAVNGVV